MNLYYANVSYYGNISPIQHIYRDINWMEVLNRNIDFVQTNQLIVQLTFGKVVR